MSIIHIEYQSKNCFYFKKAIVINYHNFYIYRKLNDILIIFFQMNSAILDDVVSFNEKLTVDFFCMILIQNNPL